MNNDLHIKPLLKYEVYIKAFDNDGNDLVDVFTAESYEVLDFRTVFYRTGNKIREYQRLIDRIVVTPADA